MRTAATFMRRAYYRSSVASPRGASYGRGVDVAGPKRRYFSSMAARIAASGLPSPTVQVAAWLVKVTRPSDSAFT